MSYTIGVLALQGAFVEHEHHLQSLGCRPVQVRTPAQLAGLDGLIIPGGESLTIGKLLADFDLAGPIKAHAQAGLPVWGTCAGMILLAREIAGSDQFRLGLMDMTVVRNAFGRQVDSFEVRLPITVLGQEPFRAVFIRAPYVSAVAPNVGILAVYEDKKVFVRQGYFLATAFHPELTGDLRVHRYFLEMVREAKE
ncbi:MAG: pyridoxal 5'-phosphate synthase glutaminase subunit PdxT [Heliobacteriaceae bacterium]|nr:pyridoxal 5'-phosphate synthase glutaminase subunit PdxT [Heliobacteriaceae bacterium]MDD4587702.1 pyridoxal 5'-phosphate synthase glutaminase subunit PdxT [Heliobacteriaceae bacterium]